ncbi:class I SAM-dependent methyltransferase [Neolewinella antarctica]|uniref:SAM-dependent methyltransferase n=1 Tax=Neolewinella antarctica TaxID=442734 RepID=A0ABX0XCY3_9BACT|nr:methyltransferase domain-containing protein [Neolewinella antarctica]NJC27145.1 SAM-dependent methyltransferase [Neolewinella antarctica]
MRTLFCLFAVALALSSCQPDPLPVQDPGLYVEDARQETRDRGFWQRPGIVMDAMGDLEEKVVADIGAGSGFFARRLAPIADRVIAIELTDSLVSNLADIRDAELPRGRRGRLEPRLGLPNDPKLADNEVDIILFVNTLMYIDSPEQYLQKVLPAMRAEGRIVVVDWKKKDMLIGPPKDARLAIGELEDMLKRAGYHLVDSDDESLEYQYIVVADKMGG